ncbi:MAG: DEAD/DEAH box helicase [Candidatus Iainarchaeum archaeon]|uniref:DEAD/DEAH box helicase n=1 Tax=Candidatus Iainarchaeum sp. TaxID=3101447 RepID=A0A7T9DJ34_9ARCH|nr:MAG: DEAD/DEAH box helicase [Candidatus Diapherotrites archaeon]
MEHVSHPLIKPSKVERRLYQEVIAAQVVERGNTLVVAPTALGKTIIAALLSAQLLQQNPEGKILFLSPTKPLAVQHSNSLREVLALHPETINVLTGANSPEERQRIWNESTIISATPQTIENDLLTGKTSLENVQLLIFDEAHRAVKDYSYVFLAKKYAALAYAPATEKKKSKKYVLALTASPGSTEEDIQDVCKNLFISHVVVKTLEDEDVKPYMHDIHVDWIKVALPSEFQEIKTQLHAFVKEQLIFFKKLGYAQKMHLPFIRSRELLELQTQLRQDMMQYGPTKPQLYQAVSRAAAVMKVWHAITLLDSQGITPLNDYFAKMKEAAKQSGSSKAAKLIVEDLAMRRAFAIGERLSNESIEHPKLHKLKEILERQFKENPESRVIVFNHYRDSVTFVSEELNKIEGIRAVRFIGQATKSVKDKGLSQKNQIKVLQAFRDGTHNTLVASSVAEEGLDIPSVDLVIFYEPAPSEIRLIQRRGRTGRKHDGKVIILMAEKTMDEAMYWSAKKKEKAMHDILHTLARQTESIVPATKQTSPMQQTLLKFAEEKLERIQIYVDQREQASTVIKALSEYTDVDVHMKQLEVGDFVIGPDVVIERKAVEDFLSSILDGRLLAQLMNMSQAYARPLLLLEGKPEELFITRNIHEHAIIGMLSAIALTYRIPILFTKDARDTARYVYLMAKREQISKDKEIRLRMGRKGLTMEEQQQFIVESLPSVGPNLAKSLLEHFGSIQKISNASLDELKEVEKIGPKKAQTILNVLTEKYAPKKQKQTPAAPLTPMERANNEMDAFVEGEMGETLSLEENEDMLMGPAEEEPLD